MIYTLALILLMASSLALTLFLKISLLWGFLFIACLLLGFSSHRKSNISFAINSVKSCYGVYGIVALLGMNVAMWMSSGLLATIIYQGLEFIVPDLFLVSAFLFSAIIAFIMGTGLGTFSTIGMVFLSLSSFIGLNPALVIGALVSGAFIADKLSFASALTQLNLKVTESQYKKYFFSSMKTLLPGLLISALIYYFLTPHQISIDAKLLLIEKQNLESLFNLQNILLLLPLLFVILSFVGVSSKISLSVMIFLNGLSAVFIQGESLKKLISYLILGYDHPKNTLFHGGGLLPMVEVILIVMAAVFGLLASGQDSFRREPEVADLNMNTRAGMDMISRDLLIAGLKVPPTMAVIWTDGGGITPDEITIVYADPNFPTCLPVVEPPSSTINRSSTLVLETSTMEPAFTDPMSAYSQGMVLIAFEFPDDCNGDGLVGVHPFELTQDPRCVGAGCERLNLNHNPADIAGLNLPGGFNREVKEDCALIGYYHVVQYRINPLPPTPNPTLERRDLSVDGTWIPVAANIENLQFEYAPRGTGIFTDNPVASLQGDTTTWITGVRATVAGRSESTNLQGGTPGVFSGEDTHLRKTFSTVVSLRNVIGSAQAKEIGH